MWGVGVTAYGLNDEKLIETAYWTFFAVFFIQRCPCPASFLMEGGLFLISEGMEPRPRADGWVPAHRFTAPGRPCIIYKCSEFLVPLSFLIQFRRWLIKRESRTQEGAQDSPSQGSLSPEVRAASRQERGSPCPSPVLPVPLVTLLKYSHFCLQWDLASWDLTAVGVVARRKENVRR